MNLLWIKISNKGINDLKDGVLHILRKLITDLISKGCKHYIK